MKEGGDFEHEAISDLLIKSRIEKAVSVPDKPAIVSSTGAWAYVVGLITIFIADCDPFGRGFIASRRVEHVFVGE